jgi:hypothetical protein
MIMVISFTTAWQRLTNRRCEDRLESHPSGLNRTDARRLSAREIRHRERMLAHLQRLSVAHLPFDRADDPV